MSLSLKRSISSGTFGDVWLATYIDTGNEVAVKKIDMTKTFEDTYKRIYREIEILQFLNSNYSIKLLSICEEKTEYMTRICLVMPFVKYDLKTILDQNSLHIEHIIKIIYQMLLALDYLFKCEILHRDLKPANVGLDEEFNLKLLDFGLAREKHDDMTTYVVSRWYRPIDVFCTLNYSTSVDIWSAGCIFVELFSKEVLFKGSGQIDQVKKIISVMGMPDEEMLMDMDENNRIGLMLFESYAADQNCLESHIRTKIISSLETEEVDSEHFYENLMELVHSCIELNPLRRAIPSKALSLPLFREYSDILSQYAPDSNPNEYCCTSLIGKSDTELQNMIYGKLNEYATNLS